MRIGCLLGVVSLVTLSACGSGAPKTTRPLQTIAIDTTPETTTAPATTQLVTSTTTVVVDVAYVQSIMNQIDHLEGEQIRLVQRLGKETPEVEAARKRFATSFYLEGLRADDAKKIAAKFDGFVMNPGDPVTTVNRIEFNQSNCIVFQATLSWKRSQDVPTSDPTAEQLYIALVRSQVRDSPWLLAGSVTRTANTDAPRGCPDA